MSDIGTRAFIEAHMQGIQALMASQHAENGRRFDEVNQRISAINGTVRRHDSEIEVLETRQEVADRAASRRGSKSGGAWGTLGGLIGGFLAGLMK